MSNSIIVDTYGPWFISLALEILLYGMGILQVWIYFAGLPPDRISIKATVYVVLFLETIQVIFFFWSSYDRFVERFGEPQTDLIWADSLQLLAAYLSAFTVQMFFADRINQLTKNRRRFGLSAFGIYIIFALALTQIGAGITQTILSYELRSFLKLDQTKPVTTLQTAASLACDLLITSYLCIFLRNQKGEMIRTNSMMDTLIQDAIRRGILTAASSLITMVLFLAFPQAFWFFLGLAPSSKLYMNSMLATLNTRQRTRDKLNSNDKGWNTIPMATAPTSTNGPHKIPGQASYAVNLKTAQVGELWTLATAL